MIQGCPGAAGLRGAPDLTIKTCPQCGGEIELFSNEIKTNCLFCGFEAYNDTQNCIEWCQYARECVGDELYEQFMSRPKQNNTPEEPPPSKGTDR